MNTQLSGAVADVIAERRRQIEVEGYSLVGDDFYHKGSDMATAAACYILFADAYPNIGQPPPLWPWPTVYWKPKNVRRDLVRGAALVIAEIERLDRFALYSSEGEVTQVNDASKEQPKERIKKFDPDESTAFGDGYYDGFLDGCKFGNDESEAYTVAEAMLRSENAEQKYADRILNKAGAACTN